MVVSIEDCLTKISKQDLLVVSELEKVINKELITSFTKENQVLSIDIDHWNISGSITKKVLNHLHKVYYEAGWSTRIDFGEDNKRRIVFAKCKGY